ncbi:Shieldin complex subunit 2 [Quaeritorhiza haematococci]|nr:Shieldin complex subunit 2 [Quaeritorhiza haematococci]
MLAGIQDTKEKGRPNPVASNAPGFRTAINAIQMISDSHQRSTLGPASSPFWKPENGIIMVSGDDLRRPKTYVSQSLKIKAGKPALDALPAKRRKLYREQKGDSLSRPFQASSTTAACLRHTAASQTDEHDCFRTSQEENEEFRIVATPFSVPVEAISEEVPLATESARGKEVASLNTVDASSRTQLPVSDRVKMSIEDRKEALEHDDSDDVVVPSTFEAVNLLPTGPQSHRIPDTASIRDPPPTAADRAGGSLDPIFGTQVFFPGSESCTQVDVPAQEVEADDDERDHDEDVFINSCIFLDTVYPPWRLSPLATNQKTSMQTSLVAADADHGSDGLENVPSFGSAITKMSDLPTQTMSTADFDAGSLKSQRDGSARHRESQQSSCRFQRGATPPEVSSLPHPTDIVLPRGAGLNNTAQSGVRKGVPPTNFEIIRRLHATLLSQTTDGPNNHLLTSHTTASPAPLIAATSSIASPPQHPSPSLPQPSPPHSSNQSKNSDPPLTITALSDMTEDSIQNFLVVIMQIEPVHEIEIQKGQLAGQKRVLASVLIGDETRDFVPVTLWGRKRAGWVERMRVGDFVYLAGIDCHLSFAESLRNKSTDDVPANRGFDVTNDLVQSLHRTPKMRALLQWAVRQRIFFFSSPRRRLEPTGASQSLPHKSVKDFTTSNELIHFRGRVLSRFRTHPPTRQKCEALPFSTFWEIFLIDEESQLTTLRVTELEKKVAIDEDVFWDVMDDVDEEGLIGGEAPGRVVEFLFVRVRRDAKRETHFLEATPETQVKKVLTGMVSEARFVVTEHMRSGVIRELSVPFTDVDTLLTSKYTGFAKLEANLIEIIFSAPQNDSSSGDREASSALHPPHITSPFVTIACTRCQQEVQPMFDPNPVYRCKSRCCLLERDQKLEWTYRKAVVRLSSVGMTDWKSDLNSHPSSSLEDVSGFGKVVKSGGILEASVPVGMLDKLLGRVVAPQSLAAPANTAARSEQQRISHASLRALDRIESVLRRLTDGRQGALLEVWVYTKVEVDENGFVRRRCAVVGDVGFVDR